jgi:hypothetical protein
MWSPRVSFGGPYGKKELTSNPNTEKMLEAPAIPEVYTLYIIASQFVHGGHFATGLYRKNLATAKIHGEFITPSNWARPLNTAWRSWLLAGQSVLLQLRGDRKQFNYVEEAKEMATAPNPKTTKRPPSASTTPPATRRSSNCRSPDLT